jgi:glycosyltransferase involved in cell wall biosynthesis
MRVLLVGNYLPDGQRSMQMYAAMLEQGLRARGHEVRLLRPPARLLAANERRRAGPKWAGYVDKFILFRGALRTAAAEADVVHLCDHSNAMYVPLIAGRPHLVTCHDLLAIRSARGHFPQNRVGPTGRLFQRMIASGLRQAGSILCVSRKTRDDLERYLDLPATRLHLVPNALPWPYRPLERGQAQIRLAGLGIRSDDDYFLHVGGDHWYKNRPAVIAIFAELRRMPQYARSKLVMAGSALDQGLRSAAARHGVADALP